MTPKSDPVPRARRPWSWLGGILVLGLLAGGLAVTALLLWEHVDMQAIVRAPTEAPRPLSDPLPPPGPAIPATDFTVHLFRSASSAGYFPDDGFHPAVVDRWVQVVEETGGRVEELGAPEEVRALEGAGLVLAPTAICLSDGEANALLEHTLHGGGLLITWATGARDGECEWRGWDVLRDLTGAVGAAQVEERPGVYLTVPSGLPLSPGLEPAARVELRWDAQVALAAEGPRVYWSDWALNPAPADTEEAMDVAAHLHLTEAGGRVVWFGFNGDEAATPLDEARITALFRNGLLWAVGIPSADLLAWPHGRQAALLLSQQAGWEFENAGNVARVAEAHGTPLTSFVASRIALDYPEMAEVLARAGEVGSRSSDDQLLVGLSHDDQRARLSRSLTQIRAWAGRPATGLRPPEEHFDLETLHAWRAVGGTYVVGLNNGRTAGPEVHHTPEGPVALLPRVMKDDYNILVQDRTIGRDGLVREFWQGLQKIHVLGGLAVLTTHTQLAGSPRQVDALTQILDSVRVQGGWWAATGGDVADWTLARQGASVSVLGWEEGRVEFEVAAPDDRPLPGAWLRVVPPLGAQEWEPIVDGTPVEFARSAWGLSVPLPSMGSGESRTILIRWLEEERE
jgi:peptidoglycan/xylan/chitin deacetylase (PgdA/CDA1 family)